MKIPKTIHQIWFQGEDQIPPNLLEYHESWKTLNPDYKILVWDQPKIEKLINQQEPWIKETYFFYEKMIQKIDFAKYVILYTYGGIYMDMDIKCLQSLNNTPSINESDIILSDMPTLLIQKIISSFYLKKYSSNNFINNGTIMCIPKSELLYSILQEAYNLKHFTKLLLNSMHVFATTGPFCLTLAYNKFKNTDNFQKTKIKILDKSYFENCTIFEYRNKTCEPPPHAIGIHYYANLWISPVEKHLVSLYDFFIKYWYIFLICLLAPVYLCIQKKKPKKRNLIKPKK